jgi:succinate dehydrogenase flavin-adding protein (antitoxin of CptAB toxin-antitoxin module)
MSASIEEDVMLASLTEEIDNKLVEWMAEHKVPPLNLTAVILARLTWLAKQGAYENDFIALLEAPSQNLNDELKEKQIH